MEEDIKSFVMSNTGHIASVGSIVLFDLGSRYPLIGKIIRLYKDNGFVYAVILQPSGIRRVRTLDHDEKDGAIALLVHDDEKVLKQWFASVKE